MSLTVRVRAPRSTSESFLEGNFQHLVTVAKFDEVRWWHHFKFVSTLSFCISITRTNEINIMLFDNCLLKIVANDSNPKTSASKPRGSALVHLVFRCRLEASFMITVPRSWGFLRRVWVSICTEHHPVFRMKNNKNWKALHWWLCSSTLRFPQNVLESYSLCYDNSRHDSSFFPGLRSF